MDITLLFVEDKSEGSTDAVPDLRCGSSGSQGKFCTMRSDDSLLIAIGPPIRDDEWDEDYYHIDIMMVAERSFPDFVRAGGGRYCVRRSAGTWKMRFYGESAGLGRFSKAMATKDVREFLERRLGMAVEVN